MFSLHIFSLFYHISLFLVSCTKMLCCQHKCSLIVRTNLVICVLFNTFLNVWLNANNTISVSEWTWKLYENSQSNQRVGVNELKVFQWSPLGQIALLGLLGFENLRVYVQDDCHISQCSIKDYWVHIKDIVHNS